MSTLVKNLFIALGITLILGLAYFFFFSKGDKDITGDLLFDSSLSAADKSERILADTQRIGLYKIEAHDDVLTDPRFESLIDRRVQIPDVSTGRSNPFAPLQ